MAAEVGLRLTLMPLICRDPDLLGAFHVEYHIHEAWDQSDEDEMGDWLCDNCASNYIFTKDTSHIIGGGCYPTKGRWQRYKKTRHRKDWDRLEGPTRSWRIRLEERDDALFKLRWLADLH